MPLRSAAVAAVIVILAAVPSPAQVPRERALADAYPGAAIRVEQIVLTPAQQKQVLTQADADVPAVHFERYVATRDGTVVGHAYLDTETVGATRQTLLISLDERGKVVRMDVIAGATPSERAAGAAVRRVAAIDEVLRR